MTTFDLDIIHSRSRENISRLANALKELDAHYREHLPKQIIPSSETLNSAGHHLLITNYGPLDILGAIGLGEDYLALQSNIELIYLNDKSPTRILNLDTLIDTKEKAGRGKDKVMLEILQAMKRED